MRAHYAFAALLLLPYTLHAQSFTDAAAYDAWKSTFIRPGRTAPLAAPVAAVAYKGGGSPCGCWAAPDSSYITINNNSEWNANGFHNADDGSFGPILLPFPFHLYGLEHDSVYININGNISFGSWYGTFFSTGLPFSDHNIVAPFWADVDLRGPGADNNIVQYKLTPTALSVSWTNVGYFNSQVDKVNTFQMTITDGTDTILPNGANVSFCYKDMQWTAGSASDGVDGFGGHSAIAGANEGNGVDYIQFGTFDQPGAAYDGPLGVNDGVGVLSGQQFLFRTDSLGINISPLIGGAAACGTMVLCVGIPDTLLLTLFSPEPGQVITPSFDPGTLGGSITANVVPGDTAIVSLIIMPMGSDTGFHTISVSGVDDGQPALTSTTTLSIQVLDSVTCSTLGVAAGIGHGSGDLRIWPNPCGDVLRFQMPVGWTEGAVRVLDAAGRTCHQQAIRSTVSPVLDVGALPAGAYLICLTGRSGVRTARFMRDSDR